MLLDVVYLCLFKCVWLCMREHVCVFDVCAAV